MTCEAEPDKTLPDIALDIDSVDGEQILFTNSDTPSWSGKTNKNAQDAQSSTSHNDNKSLNNNNNHQVSSDQKQTKTESKATPRRAQYSNSRGASKQKQSDTSSNTRPCEQHTFLTDITEVRQMEQGLLKLLDDFHSGKLQAFGKDCTFEKMEQVREQQERLARLHLELNAQQEIPQSEDERRVGRDNLGKLIENLQQLSRSIEQLQISSPSLQTDV